MSFDLERLLIVTGGIAFSLMAATWLLFARFTMARIERKMRDDGLPRQARWDGIGARAIWYAWAISIPLGLANLAHDPMIDAVIVRRYATRADRIRGKLLLTSSMVALSAAILWWLMFDAS